MCAKALQSFTFFFTISLQRYYIIFVNDLPTLGKSPEPDKMCTPPIMKWPNLILKCGSHIGIKRVSTNS